MLELLADKCKGLQLTLETHTFFHRSRSALQISKIWVHLKITFTPCWKRNQQQGRKNHQYNSTEQHPAVCLPHWPGDSTAKETGTFEKSEAAKSEPDQNLGVGIIKLLGFGLQAMRENKWVQCFFPSFTRFVPLLPGPGHCSPELTQKQEAAA